MIDVAHCVIAICSENDTVHVSTRISILYVLTTYIYIFKFYMFNYIHICKKVKYSRYTPGCGPEGGLRYSSTLP